jgi:hypothetical protein
LGVSFTLTDKQERSGKADLSYAGNEDECASVPGEEFVQRLYCEGSGTKCKA